ncbi:MAG: hypothetical protein WC408_01665 [Candidatus Micrarchaeia archaeon]
MNSKTFALFLVAFCACFAQAYNSTSVTVYKESPFGITEFTQVPDKIYPGDDVRLSLTITNVQTGYKDADLNVLVPFGEVKNYNLGAFSYGSSKQLDVNFNVPTSTKPGTYEIYLYAIIDGGQAQVGKYQLEINSPDLTNAIIASVTTDDLVVAGADTEMTVTLRNVASFDTENVLVQIGGSINSSDETSDYLLPLSSDRVFITSIKAGEEAKVYFSLAVSASAGPGYYPITLTTTYSVDKAVQSKITQTFALTVSAPASLLVTTAKDPVYAVSNSSTNIDFTIANAGGVAVRAVYAKAFADDFTFSTDNEYIGTLNLDDTATVTVTASPKGQLAAGNYPVSLNVSFKDAANVERYQVKTVNVAYAGRSGATAFGTTGTRTMQKQGTVFGISYLYIGIALVALAILGFFGFRYYKGKKAASEKATPAHAAEARKK